MAHDFSTVTELSGELVTRAQIDRLIQRYYWAGEYARNKDVLEVASGAGQGLGYLSSVAASCRAGDITPALVARATAHYGTRLPITVMDALSLPFDASTLDVVILFEAIYYLPSAEQFFRECKRVLRPGGVLLLATANRDLFDFNPSPFAVRYYGVAELSRLLEREGFTADFFGGSPLHSRSLLHQALRIVKKTAVSLRMIPGSMKGKRLLKRLVFGRLVTMPKELSPGLPYLAPTPIESDHPDMVHQVIYCVARRP
jgi:SAM-dependent methyltransferase